MQSSPYPERPVLPPMLWAFVTVAFICALILRADVRWLSWIYLGCGLGFAVILLCGLRIEKAKGLCMLLIAVGLLALFVSTLKRHLVEDCKTEFSEVPISAMAFETTSESVPSAQGYRTTANAYLPSGAQTVCWLSSDEPLNAGYLLKGVGRFSAPQDEFAAFCKARGLAGTVKLVAIGSSGAASGLQAALLRWRAQQLQAFDDQASDEHALLAAMVTGSRSAAQQRGIMDLCSQVGISHLVAVSGAHLAILAALMAAAIQKLPLGHKTSLAIQGLMGLVYVCYCGSPPSALRAWSMSQLSLGARWRGRKASSLNALGCVGCIYCLINPAVTGELGFVLSVLSVGAMVLFGPWLRAATKQVLPRRLKAPVHSRHLRVLAQQVGQASQAGILCFCATSLLVAATFSRISLLGPLVSALLAPLFSPLMMMGLASLATSSIPLVGVLTNQAASGLAGLFLGGARLAAMIPGTSFSIELEESVAFLGMALMTVVFLVAWPKPSSRALKAALGGICCILIAMALSPMTIPAQLGVLDVGQGDAILVREGSQAILVDCGPDDSVAQALQRQNVRSLDAVILTHQHDDHYGGLKALASYVRPKKIFVARGVASSLSPEVSSLIDQIGCPVEEVSFGDRLEVGSWTLEVLWPQEQVDGSENEHSLCLKATCKLGLVALLTGDAEQGELAHIAREVGQIDLLKVGHHGSAVSISPEEAHILQPVLAVASAGAHNRYGHPSEECQQVLAEAHSGFLCTKDVGDIVVQGQKTEEGNLSVHCEHAGILKGPSGRETLDAVA